MHISGVFSALLIKFILVLSQRLVYTRSYTTVITLQKVDGLTPREHSTVPAEIIWNTNV